MIWLGIWYLVIGWLLMISLGYHLARDSFESSPIMSIVIAGIISPVWPIILFIHQR